MTRSGFLGCQAAPTTVAAVLRKLLAWEELPIGYARAFLVIVFHLTYDSCRQSISTSQTLPVMLEVAVQVWALEVESCLLTLPSTRIRVPL
jgi:hypothetical protein